MSVCKSCGHSILWFRRKDGRPHPPVEPVSTLSPVYVVVDGVVQDAPMLYQRHQCDENAIAAFTARVRQQTDQRNEYFDMLEAMWAVAIDRKCPKCGAKPQEKCTNLSNTKNKGRETVFPHPARVPADFPPVGLVPYGTGLTDE